MTELEKLQAGLPYDFWDKEVDARKLNAVRLCRQLNEMDAGDVQAKFTVLQELLGSVGENANVLPSFNCDCGKNIHVGKNFLANYNVTILDIAPVWIGDYVMIGPNCLLSTVNHPISPAGRRKHLGVADEIHIGNDVWIGGNVTILPGVTIGNNVVIAAGAVVTKNVPDNCLAGGVPARVLRSIENDLEN